MLMCRFVICLAILGYAHSAEAHGIAGNRFFPGTLSFDDPAVADEAILPNFAISKRPDEGGDVADSRYVWSFFRLLTKTLGVGLDSGWVHRDWGVTSRRGFDTTNLTIKGEVYRNDFHETLVSAGLAWGHRTLRCPRDRSQRTRSNYSRHFLRKGLGDLPDSLAWLRPFGITGAVSLEHPMTGTAINFGIDEQTGQLSPMVTRKVDTLYWGFALEFSTLYLTSRFTPGKLPRQEPLNQLVPLIEFSFDPPRGDDTNDEVRPRDTCEGEGRQASFVLDATECIQKSWVTDNRENRASEQ